MDLLLTKTISGTNPVADDLELTNGTVTTVVGVTAIAQHLRMRLQIFRGEWFLDQRHGVPYYETVLTKNPNLRLVEQIFRETALSIPGVRSVRTMTLALDAFTRVLSVGAELILDTEDVLRVGFAEPFEININGAA